jgi:hypothetical protein
MLTRFVRIRVERSASKVNAKTNHRHYQDARCPLGGGLPVGAQAASAGMCLQRKQARAKTRSHPLTDRICCCGAAGNRNRCPTRQFDL